MKKIKFIYEMANNHMGDIDHGLHIVDQLREVSNKFNDFEYGVKLQYRDDSFFHPDHINRKDHKLIKRFTETRLGDKNFRKLVNYIKDNNFTAICTPWDEKAVEYLIDVDIEVIKIASCSFTDWDLLEKITKYDKEIIASTAGATKLDLDKVYSYFKNKKKFITFMHCVGEYPAANKNLHLDQIDFLKRYYPDFNIGYSTHEDPANYDNIKIALSKGATVFEKHVGVSTEKYELNSYSSDPVQIQNWLQAACDTLMACGGLTNKRKGFNEKEIKDLRILYRGAYASQDLKKGEELKKKYFLAMPNIEDQLVAKELGKFAYYKLKKDIKKNEPIMKSDLDLEYNVGNIMEKKFYIKDRVQEMVNTSNVILPKKMQVEISHHYGIDNFFEKGAILFHVINKEYSKIIIMMFPGQSYPPHFHKDKNETYFILSGDLQVTMGSKSLTLLPGDTLTVENNNVHSFKTEKGVIFEEIANTYKNGGSNYIDNDIPTDGRKTIINLD
jgi:sialic acid synthase SpsE/mannose-6-phosphate isomerase-like protein (cupin superfamily)